jgi:hypothetical protein
MFNILFPGHPLPSSAYLDPYLSEEIMAFGDFAIAHGPRLVTARLDTVDFTLSPDDYVALREAAVREGIVDIIEDWGLQQNSHSGAETNQITEMGSQGSLERESLDTLDQPQTNRPAANQIHDSVLLEDREDAETAIPYHTSIQTAASNPVPAADDSFLGAESSVGLPPQWNGIQDAHDLTVFHHENGSTPCFPPNSASLASNLLPEVGSSNYGIVGVSEEIWKESGFD